MKHRYSCLLATALLLGTSGTALANRAGITGRSEMGCAGAGCHSGGTKPTLHLQLPGTVATGQTVEGALHIIGAQPGARVPGAGANLRATAGMLADGGDGTLKAILGELTHNAAPVAFDGDTATFNFLFTAPAVPGDVTIFASGNSVNGDFIPTGDDFQTASAAITVTSGVVGPDMGAPPEGMDQGLVPTPDAGPTEEPSASDDGGCSTATPTSRYSLPALLAFGVLGVLQLRRSRRR